MPTHLNVNLVPERPGFTYGEIVSYFEKRFDEDDQNILLIIKDVLNDIIAWHPWKWLHSSSSFTTESGVAEYALEADCMTVDGDMTIDGVSLVERRPIGAVRALQAIRNANSIPVMFDTTDEGSIVVLAPIPASEYQVLYDYTKVISDAIVLADYPPLPRHFQTVLMRGIEEKMRMDDDRIDGATQLAGRSYEMRLQRMIYREARGQKRQMRPMQLPPSAHE